MKSASQELIAMLNAASAFAMADLYAFTLSNGTTLLINSSDIDLTVDGTIYPACGGRTSAGDSVPLVERSRTRLVRGTQVDSLEVNLYLDAQHKLGGVPILTLIQNGGFDGARLVIRRAFMPDFGQPVTGTVMLFSGRVSDAEATRTSAMMTVKSDLELLNVKMPRHLYQPGCVNTLYDASCGVDRISATQVGMINGPSTTTSIQHTNGAEAGFFALGVIRFDTGPNAGVTRTIRDSLQGSLSLQLPLPNPPTLGDTFTLCPGCNKTKDACAKFKNLKNFRGCPYIPVPETAY